VVLGVRGTIGGVTTPRHSRIMTQEMTNVKGLPPTIERRGSEYHPGTIIRRESARSPTNLQRGRQEPRKVASTMSYDELVSSMVRGRAADDVLGMDHEALKRDRETLQKRMVRMKRGLVNPRSNFMQRWDIATLSALFFTATITPFEVCLMWDEVKFQTLSETPGTAVLFACNWIVNIIFIIDMVITFMLPYKEPVSKGGGTVKSHYKIARHYLLGWFPIDFISIVPVDNIMMSIDTTNISNASIFSMIRMLRLLRLIKLARILRASRIFSRWENSLALSSSTTSLLKYMILIIFVVHWFACILGMMAQLMQPPRDELLAIEVQAQIDAGNANCLDSCTPTASLDVCRAPCMTDCEVEQLARRQLSSYSTDQIDMRIQLLSAEQSWACRYSRAGKIRAPKYSGELWVAGLYVAIIQLGGGVGSIVPENFAEYLVFFLCIACGSVLWAMVVGTICAVLSTGDPHLIAFKQNMDSLNYFLEDMNMPQELRIRAREFLRNTRDIGKRTSYNELVSILSPTLRQDMVMKMSSKTLETVWYLAPLDATTLVELAVKVRRSGYAPKEKVSTAKLSILMRGVAAKAGNILTPVATWGEDMIVTTTALRDRRPVSALTFIEIATLTRTDLDEVLASFPESKKLIQQAAMKIAVQRAVIVISEYMKTSQQSKGAGVAGTSKEPTNVELFEAIQAQLADGRTARGADSPRGVCHPHGQGMQVLQIMTGQAWRNIDEDQDEVRAASPMPSSSPQKSNAGRSGGSGAESVSNAAVMERLDADAKERASLTADVRGIKAQLEELTKLLKVKTVAEDENGGINH